MPVINVHPLFVHFPVSLLTIYALLELVPIKKITRQSYWFYVKAVFIILGALSTIPTILAGEVIAGQFQGVHAIVDLHSTLAITTSVLFGFLATLYILVWAKPFLQKQHMEILIQISQFFFTPYTTKPGAIVGLILIILVGTLGGIIAYGPDLDPFTKFVYTLFFK